MHARCPNRMVAPLREYRPSTSGWLRIAAEHRRGKVERRPRRVVSTPDVPLDPLPARTQAARSTSPKTTAACSLRPRGPAPGNEP